MAFVLVQHLDPTHESHLPDILTRTTRMPIVTARDGLTVQPNHVYVIPPNADMVIGSGRLALTPRRKVDHRLPIDEFFRSLARSQQHRAIGVVLSGSGSDGALGLRAIKAEGGITFVQDERSARYPPMPHNARGSADFVLPPDQIAAELARIARHEYVNHRDAPEVDEPPDVAQSTAAVLRALMTATGKDFSGYKLPTVRRRIARRMLLNKIDDVRLYVRRVRESPGEARALYEDLLIQVTGFFRDREGFESLRRTVFPALLRDRRVDDPIRIWVPGCATGEEAYSLVIGLLEFLGEHSSNLPIQMFATDLSAAAIARARAGLYPESIAGEVSAERLRRFFVRADGQYQVSKAIRDVCVFAQQDLTRDPPFSRLDLISCCNVLIYLTQAVQERVIPIFHYSLKPGGFLKLGPAEGLGRFGELFEIVDKKHKIYARKPGRPVHGGFGLTAGERSITGLAAAGQPGVPAPRDEVIIEREADRVLLSRYAPAAVVITGDMRIVQFRGRTSRYLEPAPGAATLNLLKMAREGLTAALRQAVHEASKHRSPVRKHGLRVQADGAVREVSIEVVPLAPVQKPDAPYYLVLFEESPRGRRPAVSPGTAEPTAAPRTPTTRQVARLTQELAAMRHHAQAMAEEHEAAEEELRAVTEELQSSNEELQSTNEELETAKEELQATNEELSTVNEELSSRNVELGQLSNDLGNLLASVQVPIVMVGADLRVRRITPAAERILHIAPTDIGRPIADLRLSVEVPALTSMLTDAIENLAVRQREVEARDGRWYAITVRPYRTQDNKIDGAVIAYTDIDALKRDRDQAEAIVQTVRDPLVILDAELKVVTANRAFYDAFPVAPDQAEHRPFFDLAQRQWDIPELRALLQDVLLRREALENFELEAEFPGSGRRTLVLNARRLVTPSGPDRILLAMTDVTQARRQEADRLALQREQAARAEADRTSRAKDRFLAVLSHELRTPLSAVLGWIRMLRAGTLNAETTAKALEAIERNARLQARLIDDLLDVSRIVSETLAIEARPVPVAPAVEAAVGALQSAADAKEIRLETHVDAPAGVVRGDPFRLQQIVSNLVSNAIKFTPSGGRVEVRLTQGDEHVEITVRDTGQGIAADQLPHIFGQFGAPAAGPPRQGLGLGLAIVRRLVELHGGTVEAQSAGFGQGATFTVRLPLTAEPAAEDARAPAAVLRPVEHAPDLHGIRVLVVEDEADMHQLLRAVLEQCGASVTVATSAEDALQALDEAAPHVLVSDIGLPGQDGYDLMRKVSERRGGLPALALTAHARPDDRDRAVAAGYRIHLAKPIEPMALAAAVATLAGRIQSEHRT